jgi:biotin operon repressor
MLKLDLTKTEYEKLKEELMLDEDTEKIFEMRIKGYSIAKMSMILNMSEAAVSKKISKLKKKITKII